MLEVSSRDTTKGVYITTRSEGRLFNVSRLKRRRVFGTFHTLTIQALCHILKLICKRYFTGLPPLLYLLDSLSIFEKLRSCINPFPGHRTQHRRSCPMVRHLTSLLPLNTLGAPSQTTAASTKNCRLEFSRPRSDDYANEQTQHQICNKMKCLPPRQNVNLIRNVSLTLVCSFV